MQQLVALIIDYIQQLLLYFRGIDQIKNIRLYSIRDEDQSTHLTTTVNLKYLILLFLGDLIEGCSESQIKYYVKDIDNTRQQIQDCVLSIHKNKMDFIFEFIQKYRYNVTNSEKETNIMDKEEYSLKDGLNARMVWHLLSQQLIRKENWEIRYSRYF